MKRRLRLVTASLVITVGLALAPATVFADRFHGGSRVVVANGRAVVSQQSFVHRHPFIARPFVVHRPFVPFAVVTSPAVVYAAPVYYSPPAYYPPSNNYYAPPATYSPPPNGTVSVAPAPTPSVVEFPNGRYELRGDGMTTPYKWVWIPNPPTAPPPAAPPPPAGAPSSGDPAPPRQGQLYRWTDTLGAVHWTDRLDAVPEQYRTRAKVTPSS